MRMGTGKADTLVSMGQSAEARSYYDTAVAILEELTKDGTRNHLLKNLEEIRRKRSEV